MPLVKGRAPPELAPANAGLVALSADAVVLAGLRTLRMVSRDLWQRVGDLLVDDVDDTLLDENIGSYNLGAVHENSAVVDSDIDRRVVESSQSGIFQVGRVCHDIRDEMVAEDSSQIGDRKVGNNIGNAFESGIVGNESSQVSWKWSSCDVGLAKSTRRRSLVQRHECGRDVLRNGEEGIDDMNGTTSEVVILTYGQRFRLRN